MSLSLVTLCLALVADEPIAPEKAAVIERDQRKAQAEVSARYGNKKPTELSRDERRELDKDLANADKAVLEKAGVDPKQWARESLKKDRAGYAQNKELVKGLEEKDKAAAEAKKKEGAGPGEIPIQKGISEENPVTLDEKQSADGVVPVEKGLPPDATREQVEAQSVLDGPRDTQEAPKPAKGSRRR